MRRIVLAVMSTVAAVVVLFGYRTSTSTPVSTVTATVAAGTAPTGSTAATTPAAPRSTAATTPTTPTTASSGTVTGQAEQTRWGPVQVQITVSAGRITAITLLQLPSSNPRDTEINDAAVPVLQQETLSAQSAQIDSVSGATYTSGGYISSLQSALDKAGL